MSSEITTALIGAVSAFVVALLTVILARLTEAGKERKRVRSEYINPLRLYSEEVHYRIEDMFRFPQNRQGLATTVPQAVSARPAEWFNHEGCYFASTCYLTACLFAGIERVRDGMPYLRHRRTDETELQTRILRVSHEFLDDDGIFYAVQHSIGELMWDTAAGRVVGYRKFCEMLQEPAQRVWFDRLLQFYVDVGKKRRLDQLRRAQQALHALSTLLDEGAAIQARTRAEQTRWLAPGEVSALPGR